MSRSDAAAESVAAARRVTDITFPTEIQSIHMTDTAAGGSWSELKSGCTATTIFFFFFFKAGGVGGEGEASSKSQFRVVDYSVAVSAAGLPSQRRQTGNQVNRNSQY